MWPDRRCRPPAGRAERALRHQQTGVQPGRRHGMLDQLDPVVRDATDPLQAEDDAVQREIGWLPCAHSAPDRRVSKRAVARWRRPSRTCTAIAPEGFPPREPIENPLRRGGAACSCADGVWADDELVGRVQPRRIQRRGGEAALLEERQAQAAHVVTVGREEDRRLASFQDALGSVKDKQFCPFDVDLDDRGPAAGSQGEFVQAEGGNPVGISSGAVVAAADPVTPLM